MLVNKVCGQGLLRRFRHEFLEPAEMLLVECVDLVHIVPDHPCRVEGINEVHVFVRIGEDGLQLIYLKGEL